MKEKWIVEAEQDAKDLSKILFEQITDAADGLYIDREWYLDMVIRYMRAEMKEYIWQI